MELLLISENKIKISLTKADLDGHGITSEDLDYDNTETRRVFWTLLDEVKARTGFDAAKTRIFVQIYPLRDGGCELYVSKIKETPRRGTGERFLRNSESKEAADGDSDFGSSMRKKAADEDSDFGSSWRKKATDGDSAFRKSEPEEVSKSADGCDNLYNPHTEGKRESKAWAEVYRFDEMEMLLAVCKRLRSVGYRGVSSAYSEESRCYFLSVEAAEDRYYFIEEYGKRRNAESALLYLKEHCTAICEGNAVERLGEL